ncbi:gamma-glutamyl-gamma-aminobutyrate hydrolase family protein [Butyrivibrio sp. TB]|uniref:gamma-glutamyl-gamma-aminobutyrate hydrolase family protein n=1 Tax=Butyrivibrio sp. TB TaxID=1520809 RepID=UPI0008B104EA|nr:gamma-glutamyl-gamma-aminobutyrate hydrolase family protein [Butyrivibrio sp. TB]SEQ15017.1 putative glutamine amidotransferase [Butyrivibrio sp. TB]
MKKVLFTQRVEIVASYGERRDCADQNIARFISECGYLPVPVPNVPMIVQDMVDNMDFAGIVFSGGNNLVSLGGDAPERDETEKLLLETAISNSIPVYGFCRGMQVILDYYKYPLTKIEGHVATRHLISGVITDRIVNSYHNYGCVQKDFMCKGPLDMIAATEDGVVEAIRHKELPILGTMWHPERNDPFEGDDIKTVKELFC